MDGEIYAAIAHNMSEGNGNFWSPYFSIYYFNPFQEHPPLSIYLHSKLYMLFGDYYWVDKLMGHLSLFLTGYYMVKIYQFFTKTMQFSWVVLVLWFCTPLLFWATNHNILENLMTSFIVAGFYFSLKSTVKSYFIIVSGILFLGAFLCKGVFSLYVLSIPFLLWLFLKKISFKKVIIYTLLLVLCHAIPLILLYYLNDDAKNFFDYYIDHQLLNSVKSVQTVNSRFHIWMDFFSNTAIALFLTLLIYLLLRKRKTSLPFHYKKEILFIISLSVLGILPIMISLKQREFYILSIYPFMAIGLGLLVTEKLKGLSVLSRLFTGKIPLYFFIGCITLFILTIYLLPKKTVGRDGQMLELVDYFKRQKKEKQLILSSIELQYNWTLQAYLVREGSHSLTSDTTEANFLLTDKEVVDEQMGDPFFQNNTYFLYKIK